MKTDNKKTKNNQQLRQFCTFGIDGKLFGVNITDIQEVRPAINFTPVFHAFDEVKGFVNIRGQIHLVIDLRVLLGFESMVPDKLSRIVFFKSHVGESFGVLVDAIDDVVETDENRIEKMGEANLESGQTSFEDSFDLIAGNCKLEDRILIILDSTLLLNKIKQKHEIID